MTLSRAGWIRTNEKMHPSKGCALPLGDCPVLTKALFSEIVCASHERI